MSGRDHETDDDLEARIRSSFARTRVPAAPPSIHGVLSELGGDDVPRAVRGHRVVALLAAAGIVLFGLASTALLGGSREAAPVTTGPSASTSAAGPRSRFLPPGPMNLFAPGQATSGDGWRLLGGAPRLPGPEFEAPTIELYADGGILKPLDMLGVRSATDVDAAREVVALASILVGPDSDASGCGRIRFDGISVEAATRVVTVTYTDRPVVSESVQPVACGDAGIPARFAVALSIDHLPTGHFSLRLVEAGRGPVAVAAGVRATAPTLPPDAIASVVDEAGTFANGGLWARNGRTLFTSTDAGRSWTAMALPVDPIALAILNPADVWLASPGPGSVWPYSGNGSLDTLHLVVTRTENAGGSWSTTALEGNFGGQEPVLAFADAAHGYLFAAGSRGGPASALLRTNDGGRSWTAIRQSSRLPGYLGSRFSIAPDGSLWAGSQGDAGPVARPILDVSRDGGRTWFDARLPKLAGDIHPTDSVLAPASFFGDAGVAAVAAQGIGSLLFTSTDSGRTWDLACLLSADVAAFDAASASRWYLADQRGVSVTTNGGRDWRELGLAGPPGDARIDWLGFANPDDGAALVEVGDGTPPKALYVTQDGGQTWEAPRLPH